MSAYDPVHSAVKSCNTSGASLTGLLIMNADDWGRDPLTTNKSLECIEKGSVSSVSAMVFMEDSERAANLARQRGIEAGLHMNFTTSFTSANCCAELREDQQRVARYLRFHRLAQIIFHPGLVQSFKRLVEAQIDEFNRIYGAVPERIDGHHHMHLCANVVFQRLLPLGTIVRRNFSFERGEKGSWNRLYRRMIDRSLARQHRLVDYFFSLPPLEPPERLQRIYSLAKRLIVEVETHPINHAEHKYLTEGEIFRHSRGITIAAPSAVPWK